MHQQFTAVELGIHLYAADHGDILPNIVITNGMPWSYQWRFFKELTKSYDGLTGPSSPTDKLFACPADTFYYLNTMLTPLVHASMHDDPWSDYSSYWFSRLNLKPNPATGGFYYGIAGLKISSIRNQVRTVWWWITCLLRLLLASAGIADRPGAERGQ